MQHQASNLEQFERQLVELILDNADAPLRRAIAHPPSSIRSHHPDRTLMKSGPYLARRLLSVAVIAKSPASIQALMGMGACAELEDQDGTTPLCHCVLLRHEKEAIALLECGAHPDTPCREVVKTSLRGIRNPLYLALQNGDFEMARLLLAHGANPNGFEGLGGPLFAPPAPSLSNGFHRWVAVFELLTSHGASVDLRNPRGQTLLHAHLWDAQRLRFLLYRGLDPEMTDAQGQTPLMRLREDGRLLNADLEAIMEEFAAR